MRLVGKELMYGNWKVDPESLPALIIDQARELLMNAIVDNQEPLAAPGGRPLESLMSDVKSPILT